MDDAVNSSFGYLSFVTDLTDCMMRSMLSTAQLLLSISFSYLPQTILFTSSEYSRPDCLQPVCLGRGSCMSEMFESE